MIRYADESWSELRFTSYETSAERRDEQWVDVMLLPAVDADTPLPEDVIDFSILAVCTHRGDPMQFVTLEEGCDSEYQLTENEKEQLEAWIRSESTQRLIREAALAV
jgi:hypothetical protein